MSSIIIYPSQQSPIKIRDAYDPDSISTITLLFRPPTRANDTVYYKRDDDDYDIIIPTTFTGVYYKVKHPGKSASTPPTFSTEIGSETEDGSTGLVLESVAYNLLVPEVDVISVTYENTNSVTVSSTTNTAYSCTFTIDVLPAAAIAARTFDITAHVVLSNSDKIDAPLRFKVAER